MELDSFPGEMMDTRNVHRVPKGFTLIELLVVISIIALLLSILVPALSIAKDKAKRIACMANQRNLALAWDTYATDNDGKLVNGYCWHTYMQSEGGPGCWVEPPQDKNGNYKGSAGLNIPFEYRLNGLKKGLLYPYLEMTDVFHCSGDLRFKRGTAVGATAAYQIYLSYSIPDGIHANTEMDDFWSPILRYRTPQKTAEIKRPSIVYILIEGAYDGAGCNFNDSSWNLNLADGEFWDPLGIYHNDSCTLAFADAHVESYKFRSHHTIEFFADREAYENRYGGRPTIDGNEDLQYFIKNWPGTPIK